MYDLNDMVHYYDTETRELEDNLCKIVWVSDDCETFELENMVGIITDVKRENIMFDWETDKIGLAMFKANLIEDELNEDDKENDMIFFDVTIEGLVMDFNSFENVSDFYECMKSHLWYIKQSEGMFYAILSEDTNYYI